MNEYFRTLQKLLNSTEQLLAGEYSSLDSVEIQDSAKNLNQSIQPCLKELKIYATQFNLLIKACLKDLDHAEDVWNSKQRVLDLSTVIIWEQLGELTGFDTQFQELCQKQLQLTINCAQDLSTEMIESIKKQHFWNVKNRRFKIDLGWEDKDNFNKYIANHIELYTKKLEKNIESDLEKLSLEFSKNVNNTIYAYLNLLDTKNLFSITRRYDKILKTIQECFENVDFLMVDEQGGVAESSLFSIAKIFIDKWKTQRGYIERNDIDGFGVKFKINMENNINNLFFDRMQFTQKLLKIKIHFYNDLLEKKSRYRQETPEQRLTEKAWIDQQRQALEEMQTKLDEIMN